MDTEKEPKSASYHASDKLAGAVSACTPIFDEAYTERKFKAIVEALRTSDGRPLITRIPSPCQAVLREMLLEVGVALVNAHDVHCNHAFGNCTCNLVGSTVFSVVWCGEQSQVIKL